MVMIDDAYFNREWDIGKKNLKRRNTNNLKVKIGKGTKNLEVEI